MSDYSGSIKILYNIKAKFTVHYFKEGKKYTPEIWLDGNIANLREFLLLNYGFVDNNHFWLIHKCLVDYEPPRP